MRRRRGTNQPLTLALRWGDVDLRRGQLTIRRQLVEVGGKLEFAEPKTKAALRTITLPVYLTVS